MAQAVGYLSDFPGFLFSECSAWVWRRSWWRIGCGRPELGFSTCSRGPPAEAWCRETIDEQNLLTLRDVLSTLPGITFGAGEGGGYGDSINLRGFSANNDITIDGIRDNAQYVKRRTATFSQNLAAA